MKNKKADKKFSESESAAESGLKDKGQDELEINDEVLNFEDDLKKLHKEIDQQKEKFLRLAAEYDNYRKRTERDKLNIYQDAVANTVKELLPVVDSLSVAVSSEQGSDEDYKKGLELVNNQLMSSFNKLSVESFGNVGDSFNPEIHHAIAHIDSDEFEENVITEVFRLGYKVNDKVIRCAMVKVAN